MPKTMKKTKDLPKNISVDRLKSLEDVREAELALIARRNEILARARALNYKPPRGKGKLKLFVWEDVLEERYGGIAFAMAYTADHARALIVQSYGDNDDLVRDLKDAPAVYKEPKGYAQSGGD